MLNTTRHLFAPPLFLPCTQRIGQYRGCCGCTIQLYLTDADSSSSSTTCPVLAPLRASAVASSVGVTEVQYFVSPETIEESKTKHIAMVFRARPDLHCTPADIAVILPIDRHREQKPQTNPPDQAVLSAIFRGKKKMKKSGRRTTNTYRHV